MPVAAKPPKPPIDFGSMPDPKRLRIINKLRALLEGINPTQDFKVDGVAIPYPIDMRGNLFVGRLTVSTEEAENAMSILENPRPLDGSEVGWDKLLRMGDWILLLQGWPRDDIHNPTAPAYKMAALAEERLSRIVKVDKSGDPMYPEHYLLGTDSEGDPEIERLSIGQSVVRPSQDANTRLAMFYIPLTVRLATDPSNPFL